MLSSWGNNCEALTAEFKLVSVTRVKEVTNLTGELSTILQSRKREWSRKMKPAAMGAHMLKY
jgi:hypothetical protein